MTALAETALTSWPLASVLCVGILAGVVAWVIRMTYRDDREITTLRIRAAELERERLPAPRIIDPEDT